jgi:hypothetical protein
MRKLLWIVLALLVVSGAPVAHADSFTLTFTCISSCSAPPTASDVTFPSPTLAVGFDGLTFFPIPLSSSDLPGDQYTWFAHDVIFPIGTLSFFDITDVTTNTTSEAVGPFPVFRANGSLTFTPVTAPEPSSVALMLAGIGLLLVLRKRIGQGLPQAS